MAYGIKDNAFSYLLLIYSNNCLGVRDIFPGLLSPRNDLGRIHRPAVRTLVGQEQYYNRATPSIYVHLPFAAARRFLRAF